MGSVYLNDVDAYQRLLDQYRRKVRDYNGQADAFNSSFYTDAAGNRAGMVGGVWTGNAPLDKAAYALYRDPNDPNQSVLRRPDSTTAEIAQLTSDRVTRAITLPNGERITFASNRPGLADQQLYQRGYVAPNIGFDRPNGELVLQKAMFSDAPVAPEQFKQRAPEATVSQARRLEQPTLAQTEAGLIAELIHSKGVIGGSAPLSSQAAPAGVRPAVPGFTTTPSSEEESTAPPSDSGSSPGSGGWSSLSAAEQAAWYAEHPTMSTITQAAQNLFGYTSMGALQNAMNPDFVDQQGLIAQGIDPGTVNPSSPTSQNGADVQSDQATNTGVAPEGSANAGTSTGGAPADLGADIGYGGGGGTSTSGGTSTGGAPADLGADIGYGGPPSGGTSTGGAPADLGADIGYGGGGTSTSGSSSDTSSSSSSDTSSSSSSDTSSGDSGGSDSGGGGGDSGWAKGGPVTRDRLKGPNPRGKDDGYGALDAGEFVIRADVAKRLGLDRLRALNAGKAGIIMGAMRRDKQ